VTATTSRPTRQAWTTAAVLWVLASTWYLISEAVTARALPGYSYAHHYISDLGVPASNSAVGSPLAAVMNLGLVHQGLLFITAAGFARRGMPAGRGRSLFLALAVVHGAGTALVGIVHSGAEGVAALHGAGAAMAIVGGNLAVITAGTVAGRSVLPRWFRAVSTALGIAGLTSVIVLLVNAAAGRPFLDDGVWERGAVYTVNAWEFTVAAAVLATRGRARA
jgi:hypothetical membrane protein